MRKSITEILGSKGGRISAILENLTNLIEEKTESKIHARI